MSKAKFTEDDDALLAELGVEAEANNVGSRSPSEERIIAGFEDIERFFEQNNRLPTHGEEKDIFERLYAVRLDKIRASEECRSVLAGLDKHGLLQTLPITKATAEDAIDDDALLAELGVLDSGEHDITKLTHVKTRAEMRAAEEIAKRTPCLDFDKFRHLFIQIQEDLQSGVRKTREFKENAQIRQGEFFILGGQKAYVAEMGEEIKAPNGDTDARLRVIYDNGTESNLLLRSLQRALYKDEAGRRITDPSAGPLFSDEVEDGDIASGTIYVLRSKSHHPFVSEHRELIHKIGVTGGKVETRIANAASDPTYLMSDVEIVATYKLFDINRSKLEKIFHRLFSDVQIDLEIQDRFGRPIKPKEWFLVPLQVIDDAVRYIQNNSITEYLYNPKSASLEKRLP